MEKDKPSESALTSLKEKVLQNKIEYAYSDDLVFYNNSPLT